MISIETEICVDFEASSSREWLETNGIGGYASSTVSGVHTRRYHGLLVAATIPPLGRMVLLSKFEETLVVDGVPHELSCNQYPGEVHPAGYRYLTGFRLDPFPVWTYEVERLVLERSVFMIYGENSVVCRWKIVDRNALQNRRCEIELRPLLAFRDHHHLRGQDDAFSAGYEIAEGLISLRPHAEMPELNFAHNAKTVEPQGYWYRDFQYKIERERGFDHSEDLFQPFVMEFDLTTADAVVRASADSTVDLSNVRKLEIAEKTRRRALIETGRPKDVATEQLMLAADQFIVERGTGKTVIAGYHWFSDWGRDTMIALPGLTLATNRPEVAKSVLTEFSRHISAGMLPNRFPDAGETPDYNTVDATLWFFEAIRALGEHAGDYVFVRETLFDKLDEIIDWHVRGTRYGIHVDTDGLLSAGEPGVQLTWMDAKIGDRVITPRTGKAVEIQALWYNALCIAADLAARFGDTGKQTEYSKMAQIARESFNGQFWNEDGSCLFDVVAGEEKDASVRPNQIFAVSLPHTMLDPARALAVIDKVEAELLTPFGLRSLSPNDPAYTGVYIGSPEKRDAAYHQGTVWAWLIGPFVDAYARVHADDDGLEQRIRDLTAGFEKHLGEAMLGQISEIFDGDPPHTPRGCAAQAWSVAEVLRVMRH